MIKPALLITSLLLVFFSIYPSLILAQDKEKSGKGRTEEIDAIKQVLFSAPDSAKILCEKLIHSLSREDADDKLILASAYRFIGIASDITEDYSAALSKFDSSAKYAKQANDSIAIANTILGKGIVYQRLKKYGKAFEHYDRALLIYQNNNDPSRASAVINNLGVLYTLLEMHDDAIALYRGELQKVEARKDSSRLSSLLLNLASAYVRMEQLDSAINYVERVTSIAKAMNDYYSLSGCYQTRAVIYKDLGMLDSADHYYDLTIEPSPTFGQQKQIGEIIGAKAEIQLLKNNYRQAAVMIDSAIRLLTHESNLAKLKSAYHLKARVEEARGNAEAASNAFKQAYLLYDSIYNDDVRIQAFRHSFNRKEKALNDTIQTKAIENRALQQMNEEQRWLLITVSIIALLLLTISGLIYYTYKQRSSYLKKLKGQNEELENRLANSKRMLSVLAHDFKSPLTTISSMLTRYEEGEISESDRSSFTQKASRQIKTTLLAIDKLLFWLTWENQITQKETIELTKIMDEVADFYHIELERADISISFEQLNRYTLLFDLRHMEIIARNIIGNSIKYSEPGAKIEVNFSERNEEQILSFHDNGPGIPKERLKHLMEQSFNSVLPNTSIKSSGMGIQLVNELCEMNDATLHIDATEGKGTSVSIILKKGSV